MASSLVASRQLSKDLEGIPTDVLVQKYADRVLVLVTQLGKVGNLVYSIILFIKCPSVLRGRKAASIIAGNSAFTVSI
jgi:hypothetical protein